MALSTETTPGFPSNLGGTVKKVDGATPVDNVFTYSSAGSVWQRIFDGGNSVYRASWLFITGAPADKTALVNIALAASAIGTLEIDVPITLNGSVAAAGKTIVVQPGGLISGTGTIDNVVLSGDATQQLAATTLTFTNAKNATGKWLPTQFGATGDGVTDDYAAINFTNTVANANSQKSICLLQGNYLLGSNLTIPTTVTILLDAGAYFSGVATITGGAGINAYDTLVFGDDITVVSIKTSGGKFPATWWGCVGDGVTDNTTNLQRCATSVSTCYQKTILFSGNQYPYLISSTVTIADDIILSFENGAIINSTTGVDGGVIKAARTQQIFTSTSIVNPYSSTEGGLISAMWFGAPNDDTGDAQPAIQNASDTIVRNNLNFKTLWLPNGTYRTLSPIIVYKWNGTVYQNPTVYIEGEGTMWPASTGVAARINPQFKDTFAIGIQRGKGCKINGIYITGGFIAPFSSGYSFFSCPFNDFVDPTCRDSRWSPFSAIVIDPFTNSLANLPGDGGYPGLTDWYRGPGGNGGSTGTDINDVSISGFVVGVCSSPNGTTRNQELCSIKKIQFYQCKLCVAGGQDQEKLNVVDTFGCWGLTHTIFATGYYGATTPGNWYLSGGNIAGQVVRLIHNEAGGYFPSYIENIYAEELGTIGTLNSRCGGSVINSVFNFSYPFTTKYTQWHIQGSGFTFNTCTIRYYGDTTPINIYGNNTFNNCIFGSTPFVVGESNGILGSAQFINCKKPTSFLGATGDINYFFPHSTMITSSPYGDYTVYDVNDTSKISGWKIKNDKMGVGIGIGVHSVVPSGSDRTIIITLSLADLYKVDLNRIIYCYVSGINTPLGVVTNINAGTGAVTISYCNNFATASYSLLVWQPIIVGCPFIGDTTNGSPNVTNCKTISGGSISDNVGRWIKSPPNTEGTHGDYSKMLSYSGTTAIMSNPASATVSGVFYGDGEQFYTLKTKNASLPDSLLLKVGCVINFYRVSSARSGIPYQAVVIKSGYIDPSLASDTRRAYFVPTTVPMMANVSPIGLFPFPAGVTVLDENTGLTYLKTITDIAARNGGNTGWVRVYGTLSAAITTSETITPPSGANVVSIVVTSTTTQSGLLIGTTPGGSEIDTISFTGSATAGASINVSFYCTGSNSIYISNVAGTVNYRIILQ